MKLNDRANQTVEVSISSPSSMDSRDDGHVDLTVRDRASGELLVHVEIPAGRWWRLCQGGTQTWPALVSPHLERVGQELETAVVTLPRAEDGDTAKDVRRDVYRATMEQRPEWEDFQEVSVRRTNRGREAVLRRWKKAAR